MAFWLGTLDLLCSLLVLILASVVGSLNCYHDLDGIKLPDDDRPVNVAKFERINCSLYSISQKVVKPCMTKTDRSGIVTRSCATIPKTEEACEEDDRGALLCYCLTSYCNGAGVAALGMPPSDAPRRLAWCTAVHAVAVALSRWRRTWTL